MMPVSVLPAAGLLVALGRVLQDSAKAEGVVQNESLLFIGNIFFHLLANKKSESYSNEEMFLCSSNPSLPIFVPNRCTCII